MAGACPGDRWIAVPAAALGLDLVAASEQIFAEQF
jgi:hypothetical protein